MSLAHKNAKKVNGGRSPKFFYNSTESMNVESTLLVAATTTPWDVFMAFIPKLLKKRISTLISRFDVPKIPPHMINQLGVEKEATSTN